MNNIQNFSDRWQKALMRVNIALSALVTILEIIVFYVLYKGDLLEQTVPVYIRDFIFVPSAIIWGSVIFLLIANIRVKKRMADLALEASDASKVATEKYNRALNFAIISVLIIIGFVCGYVHGKFGATEVAMLVPVVISIGFYNMSLTVFTFILCEISVMAISIHSHINWGSEGTLAVSDAIILMGILAAVAYVSTVIIRYMNRQNKDLLSAIDDANTANRAKSSFLANMSHEIRTPINGILGMDSMIIKETNQDAILGYAKNIQSAGSSLLSIINDILDISKIESGKMEIVPAEYNFSKVLRDCYNMAYFRAEDKGLEFDMDINPEIPSRLFGDEIRIIQIINNLLSNAVKYTKEGGVKLLVSHTWESKDEISLHITIADTGIGIKEDDMERLFSSFERLEEERNRGIEGTGLGLNLTKHLINMMGGKIEVESTYGKGSKFSIHLNQKVIDAKPIGEIQELLANISDTEVENIKAFTAENAKILIVDDIDMNLQVVCGLLRDTKINIDTAMSGFVALDKTREEKYDIIFLDHQMPKMDGIETAARIKSQEDGQNLDTPIVMLTANALSGARDEYISKGFYDYLSKPIEEALIKDMIRAILPDEYISFPEAISESSQKADPEMGLKTQQVTPEKSGANPRCVIAGITEDTAKEIGMDFDAGLGYCMNDEEFYANMILMYTSAKRSEELSGYLEKEDFENYRICVHALKSTSASIGLSALSEEAKLLEDACKEENYGYVRENHERVMEMYDKVCIAIGTLH